MSKNWTWRDSAKEIIAKVLKENEGNDIKAKRKALYDAYPFGQRAMHPYKIWCDECRVQLGLKKKKIKSEEFNPKQTQLF